MRQPQGFVLVVDHVINGQRNGLDLAVGKKASHDSVGVTDVGHEKSAVVEKQGWKMIKRAEHYRNKIAVSCP